VDAEALRALLDRIKAFKKRNLKVLHQQDGQPYTYSGASSAWKRAVQRAGITNALP